MRKQTGGMVQMKVSRFLFQYRTTPHITTGVSPAELLLNRKLRNHLDLLRPDLATKVLQKQSCQKDAYDRHAKYREIHENDKVLVKDFTSKKPVWLPGVVTKETGLVISRSSTTGWTGLCQPPPRSYSPQAREISKYT